MTSVEPQPARLRAPGPRVPPWVWDVVAALVVLLSAAGRFPESADEKTAIGWVASLVPVALMLVRRYIPWSVLIATVVCFAIAMFSFPLTPGSTFAVAIALYTVSVRVERRDALWAALAAAVVMVAAALVGRHDMTIPAVFQVIVTLGCAVAIGDAVRTRRAYVNEITQRAIRAEETREAEASRRVAEDRLRIARDLHDAVAHQISVISLNAGVADSALEGRPEVAREALATIRIASRTVLGEIGDLLAALRLPEERAAGAPTVGLAGLDGLIRGFEDAGLHVTLRVEGELPELRPAVDVVAYRVIQEGLTNAHKHGAEARAHLLIEVRTDALSIIVTNPVHESSGADAAGHGLVGVRERVEGVHGTVTAARDGSAFRLAVLLPLDGGGLA